MTATRTLPSSVQSPPGRPWSVLAVLMIGTFMFVLDFFIVNVALPSIQQDLRAGEGAIEWIVAGYAVSTAVLLVTGAGSATSSAAAGYSPPAWRYSSSPPRPARWLLIRPCWSRRGSCRESAPR